MIPWLPLVHQHPCLLDGPCALLCVYRKHRLQVRLGQDSTEGSTDIRGCHDCQEINKPQRWQGLPSDAGDAQAVVTPAAPAHLFSLVVSEYCPLVVCIILQIGQLQPSSLHWFNSCPFSTHSSLWAPDVKFQGSRGQGGQCWDTCFVGKPVSCCF